MMSDPGNKSLRNLFRGRPGRHAQLADEMTVREYRARVKAAEDSLTAELEETARLRSEEASSRAAAAEAKAAA
eukprot:3730649-Prymnesium_polylepis.1